MHSVVRNHLESYLDGTLLPVMRREVDAHIRECAECRQEVEEGKLTNEWMQALVTELMMPAPGFYARVRSRIEAEGSQIWPFWQLMPVFSRQLSFAVMTMLLLLGGFLFTLRVTEDRPSTVALVQDAPIIRAETPVLNASDAQSNRQRVMVALVGARTAVEGD